MSSKATWFWMAAAVGLFGFIFVFQRYFQHEQTGPKNLLSGLDPKTVRTVQIRPAGQREIRAERTNGIWHLVEPIIYPAQGTNVDNLLNALQRLTIAHTISEQDLRKDPDADENYGIEPPQLSLLLAQPNSTNRVYFGRRTTPGDQVFVQIIGHGGVFVVDADVLNLFPSSSSAWRDTALLDFSSIPFDGISVTNSVKNLWFQLQRDPTNRLWSMAQPMKARADTEKVESALQSLGRLHVQQFSSDDPKADLDAFGLQPPQLTLAFAKGTNAFINLDFGKELTNAPGLVYARRRDQSAIVAVSTNTLGPWRSSYQNFRDRHLLTLTGPLEKIDIQGRDHFSLVWQTNNSWRVMPQDFPADTALTAGLARAFAELQVAGFEKDSVTKPDLAYYGLASPARKFILVWADSTFASNAPVELDFGTNNDGKIFAQRVGEDAVYGITPADFEKLPTASWEMRQRQIWNFDVNDISQITIRQNGKTRELAHHGTNGWSLVGAQGIINDSAVESTAGDLGHLAAFSWAGYGSNNLAAFGFAPQNHQLSIQLINGEKLNVQFGGPTRFGTPYAVVNLENEPWIFEFPPDLYSAVRYCLTIPDAP
jgi:hypothetical protein